MAFPLTVPITLVRDAPAGFDVYGDPIPGGRPEEVLVFGVVEGGDEPTTSGRPERVRYDLTVYAPASLGVTARDRFIWGGAEFEVDGPPGCWDANPWWSPGLVAARCNRVEG